MELNRRRFLGASALGAFHSVSAAPLRAFVSGLASDEQPACLVLLQLSGGNDGLNTVVPFRDDAYFAARPKIAHPKQDILKLERDVGFAPALKGLHRLASDGRLGVQLGVGYPEPNRSHFKSMDVWHTADLGGRAAGAGWIGRLAAVLPRDDRARADSRVVHLGRQVPYALHSVAHPAIAFGSPNTYRFAGQALAAPNAQGTDAEPKSNLEFLRQTLNEAHGSSQELRAAVAGFRPAAEYPSTPLAASLQMAAALIDSRVGVRVLSVEHGGFDTHTNQLESHADRLEVLDAALTAFLDDLAARGADRRALVVCFSEFGRRLAENGSRGTDHGTAAPVLVAGGLAQPGVHGKHPSLTELDERGDMLFTCDFRSIYSSALEHTFGIEPQRVLGARFDPAPCVART